MVDWAAHTANMINRLGQPVTLTPSGQPARVVNAVFTSHPADAFGMVSGQRPSLRVATADSTGLAPGDAAAVGGKNYVVIAIDDDSDDSGDRVLRLDAA